MQVSRAGDNRLSAELRTLRNQIRTAIEARCPAADFIEGEILLIECLACHGSRFDPFSLELEKGADIIEGTLEWIDGWIVAHESCENPR